MLGLRLTSPLGYARKSPGLMVAFPIWMSFSILRRRIVNDVLIRRVSRIIASTEGSSFSHASTGMVERRM